jgi:predicted RNA-binding protein YlxR (DUF448 family)
MKKHIPMRTCIGCRQVAGKRELLRIVRTPEGQVVADPTGKKAGRGTYVHKQHECLTSVLDAHGRLEHALNLERQLDAAERAALVALSLSFPTRDAAGTEPNVEYSRERRAQIDAASQNK